MPTVSVVTEVNKQDIQRLEPQATRRIEAVLNTAMDKVLTVIELIQIHKYLSDAFPTRPPGSIYQRTFNLRDASQKIRTGRTLPEIGGEWTVDEGQARYGPKVIGTRGEQAPIHQGRWLSQEEIEERAAEIAPGIVQEELDREIQI